MKILVQSRLSPDNIVVIMINDKIVTYLSKDRYNKVDINLCYMLLWSIKVGNLFMWTEELKKQLKLMP